MMHRSHDALRGLAALGATLAFVVGLPLALAVVVGNPLPSVVPTWDALRVAFERSSVQSEVVANVLAVLLWAVWARGTLALVAEALAAWRGRPLEAAPTSMGARAVAARAIASITLLTVLLPGRVALAAPLAATVQPAPVVAAAALVDDGSAGAPAPSPSTPTPPSPESPASGTYIVGPRDTWWSVAEAALDDGLRWREVRDLSVGRTMEDGHVVSATDEQLGEGWKVLIPGAAVALSATTATVANEVLVAPGDTLWHIAEHELGDPLQWPKVFDANAERVQGDGDALRDPDLIQPGWRLNIPAETIAAPGPGEGSTETVPLPEPPLADGGERAGAAGEAPSTSGAPDAEATAPGSATSPAPRRERPLRAPGRAAPAPAVEDPGPAAVPAQPASSPVGVAGMAAAAAKLAVIGVPALAATGVVLSLGRLRRRQLRRRRPDRSLPLPDPALEPLERHLRAIAADEVAEWVELTLRLLTLRIAEADYDVVPQVLVVQAGEFGVEVLLDQPCTPPPAGFEVVDDPRVWRLGADVEMGELREVVAAAPVISPALVSLGVAPEGPVLVDLEALGVLSVEGDEHRVRAFLAGVAMQLATASWSEIELAVLEGDLGVDPLERGPACADVDDLVERVATSARATASALGDGVSTTAARVAEADADPWSPVVAVVGPDRREELLGRMAEAVGLPGRGGALVAAGPVRDATWRLSISASGRGVLSPLGLEVDVSGVDYETVTGASRLLEVAAEEGDNAPLVDLAAESARHQAPHEVTLSPEVALATGQQRLLEAPGPSDVVVRVLGRPEVTGWNSPASRKVSEIVVYLATHDAPVPSEQLRGAMWPLGDTRFNPSAARSQTTKSAVHRTRVALGFDSQGRAHLPPAKDGRYQLGPDVRCDWREFQVLVAAARRQPREDAVAPLRSALELVRGAPFSYVGEDSYGWASSELIASDMEIAIGDAAHRLCLLALSQGDDELAMWATRQGLLASPGQEALYRDRMEAAEASGDPVRLRAVLQDAQRTLRSIDPLEELQEETVAHFEERMATLQRRRA